MRTGAVCPERTTKPINSMVSVSHHCRSSMISRRGRSPTTMARLTASNNRWRWARSPDGLGADGWEASRNSGRRRASSALQTVSSVSMWLRSASDRKEVDDRTPRRSARSLVGTSRCHHVSLCSNPAAEFQCETGLADPRFAGDQHEVCPIRLRGVPCLVELVPFEVTAHEGRFGDRCPVPPLDFVAVEGASAELLVQGPDLLARCHREVALKHLRIPVVGARAPIPSQRIDVDGFLGLATLVTGVIPPTPLGLAPDTPNWPPDSRSRSNGWDPRRFPAGPGDIRAGSPNRLRCGWSPVRGRGSRDWGP